MKTLDYETVKAYDEWQVWTPDITGAIIGLGNSPKEALRDAVDTLRETANEIQHSLE